MQPTDSWPLFSFHKQSHKINLIQGSSQKANLQVSLLSRETALKRNIEEFTGSYFYCRERLATQVTQNSPITESQKEQVIVPKCIQKIKMHSDFKGNFFTQMCLKQNCNTGEFVPTQSTFYRTDFLSMPFKVLML